MIDNGKMLRNFVQIMRSGVTGRKSLGSLPKRLVCDWLDRQSEAYLFEATVGQKPYQLLAAYLMAGSEVPQAVQSALQDAMELAIANVPRLDGKVYVCPDVSGSMTGAAITGIRQGATSKVRGEMVIFVSDNQSWLDAVAKSQGTAMMREWNAFKQRNPAARLVCLDIQPYATTQAYDRADVLNIGGFSDQVFQAIADFAAEKLHPEHWVGLIEQVSL